MKNKILVFRALFVFTLVFGFATLSSASVYAQTAPACNGSTFDTFATGTVNGQNGWHVSGDFDQEIVPNSFGYPSLGCQSLRLSDATTSVFIFNQTFSHSTTEAGETDGLDSNGATGTPRGNRFEAQFDLATVTQDEQPGLHMSVSPDRGDGTRMSSLGFTDTATGIDVFFDDVSGTSSPVTFNNIQIATGLTRSVPHTFKFLMDFIDGASNDIVQMFIDGNLVHTGSSWENFYRYDNDAFPSPDSATSRTVNSLVFYERGTATPGNLFNGYLVDNLSITATTTATTTPVASSSAPVITLNGSSTMNVAVHTSFTDPGATATDDVDGTVAVAATGTVDIDVVGGYAIIYTAVDSHSNVATTTRIVNVVATSTATSSSPIVTLNGSSSVSVMVNTEFVDPGATATDDIDGTLTVVATGTVNTNLIGDYTLTYSATDSHGNVGSTTRTVRVIGGTSSGGGSVSGGGGYFIFSPIPGQSSLVPTNSPSSSSPISVVSVSTPTGQVLGVAVFNFKRNMKIGSTGDDVQELQKMLAAQGYLVLNNPTKYFGSLTWNAVKKWQKANGLPATGYFGPMSRAFLVK